MNLTMIIALSPQKDLIFVFGLGELYTVCFHHSHPSLPTPPKSTPPFPTHLTWCHIPSLSFSFYSTSKPFMFSICPWVPIFLLECDKLTRGYNLRENGLYLSNSLTRCGIQCPTPLSELGFGLAWAHTGCVHAAASLLCQKPVSWW